MSDTRPGADLASTSPSPMERLPRLTPGVGFTLLDGVRVLDLTTSESVSVLIAESNEVHVLDLLTRVYFIARGSVSDKKR